MEKETQMTDAVEMPQENTEAKPPSSNDKKRAIQLGLTGFFVDAGISVIVGLLFGTLTSIFIPLIGASFKTIDTISLVFGLTVGTFISFYTAFNVLKKVAPVYRKLTLSLLMTAIVIVTVLEYVADGFQYSWLVEALFSLAVICSYPAAYYYLHLNKELRLWFPKKKAYIAFAILGVLITLPLLFGRSITPANPNREYSNLLNQIKGTDESKLSDEAKITKEILELHNPEAAVMAQNEKWLIDNNFMQKESFQDNDVKEETIGRLKESIEMIESYKSYPDRYARELPFILEDYDLKADEHAGYLYSIDIISTEEYHELFEGRLDALTSLYESIIAIYEFMGENDGNYSMKKELDSVEFEDPSLHEYFFTLVSNFLRTSTTFTQADVEFQQFVAQKFPGFSPQEILNNNSDYFAE